MSDGEAGTRSSARGSSSSCSHSHTPSPPPPPLSPHSYQQKKQYLEAAIVRTMKARHELSHRALVDEVTDQIKLFSVKGRNCKRAIEGLIERGYMERHATREKTYLYRG